MYALLISISQSMVTNCVRGRREDKIDEARSTFNNIAGRKLDWPEMIFDAWTSFERLYGSLDQIQACLDRVEREQANVDARRARDVAKASQDTYQISQQMETAASNLISQAVTETSEPGMQNAEPEAAMDVDQHVNDSSRKRKLETEVTDPTAKKAKPGKIVPLSSFPCLVLHESVR